MKSTGSYKVSLIPNLVVAVEDNSCKFTLTPLQSEVDNGECPPLSLPLKTLNSKADLQNRVPGTIV